MAVWEPQHSFFSVTSKNNWRTSPKKPKRQEKCSSFSRIIVFSLFSEDLKCLSGTQSCLSMKLTQLTMISWLEQPLFFSLALSLSVCPGLDGGGHWEGPFTADTLCYSSLALEMHVLCWDVCVTVCVFLKMTKSEWLCRSCLRSYLFRTVSGVWLVAAGHVWKIQLCMCWLTVSMSVCDCVVVIQVVDSSGWAAAGSSKQPEKQQLKSHHM